MPVKENMHGNYGVIGTPPSSPKKDKILLKPADIKNGEGFFLYGKEANQLTELLAAIHTDHVNKGDGELIQKKLNEISKEYVELFFNTPIQSGKLEGRFYTPLHFAAYIGNVTALRIFAEMKVNFEIDAIDENGDKKENIFLLSIENDQPQIIEYLIKEYKFPLTQENLNELLYQSINSSKAKVAEVFIHCGANVNFKTKSGHTLLHVVCENYFYKASDLMIGNSKENSSVKISENLISLLIKHQADQTLKNPFVAQALAAAMTVLKGKDMLTKTMSSSKTKEFMSNILNANTYVPAYLMITAQGIINVWIDSEFGMKLDIENDKQNKVRLSTVNDHGVYPVLRELNKEDKINRNLLSILEKLQSKSDHAEWVSFYLQSDRIKKTRPNFFSDAPVSGYKKVSLEALIDYSREFLKMLQPI